MMLFPAKLLGALRLRRQETFCASFWHSAWVRMRAVVAGAVAAGLVFSVASVAVSSHSHAAGTFTVGDALNAAQPYLGPGQYDMAKSYLGSQINEPYSQWIADNPSEYSLVQSQMSAQAKQAVTQAQQAAQQSSSPPANQSSSSQTSSSSPSQNSGSSSSSSTSSAGAPSSGTGTAQTGTTSTSTNSQTTTSGSSNNGSNPNTNVNGGQTVNPPADTATMGEIGIGDPSQCWLCEGVYYTLGAVETVVDSGSSSLISIVWPLMVVLGGISFIIRVGRSIIEGTSPYPVAAKWFGKMAIVGAVFLGGSIAPFGTSGASGGITADPGVSTGLTDTDMTGGSSSGISSSVGQNDNGSLLFDYIIGPPIDSGAAVGVDLTQTAAQTLGLTTVTPTQTSSSSSSTTSSGQVACNYDPGKVTLQHLQDAATQLVNLVCQVHVMASYGIEAGAYLAVNNGTNATIMDQATSFILFFVGAAVMLLCFMALLNFGFALMEVMLKVGIIVTFFPLLLCCWLFDSTRGMIGIIGKMMLFSFVYLVFSGLGSIVMGYVMLVAFTCGMGSCTQGSAVQLSNMQAIVQQAQTISLQLNSASIAGFQQGALFAGYALAGALMAARILKAVQNMSADITGFGLGRQGAMANVGTTIVARVGSVAMAGVGVGAAAVGRAVGGAAGRGLGHVAGQMGAKAAGQGAARTAARSTVGGVMKEAER